MFKKLLVFVCVLALALGVFSVTAAANEGAKTGDVTAMAGYSMVDITPYWSVWTNAGKSIPHTGLKSTNIMPLPMDGYGNTMSRLAESTLSDDGGTTQTGDGLHATCVALQTGNKVVLLISVDLLRIPSINDSSTNSWLEDARAQIIAAAAEEGVTLENADIMVSATHTHGSIDVVSAINTSSTKTYTVGGKNYTNVQISAYLDVYKAYLKSQLATAAREAIAGLSEVTQVRKGTIDVGVQTGEILNGVRHYAQPDSNNNNYTYVRGSNFNTNMYGTDSYTNSTAVSQSDDSLHLLELTVEDHAKPIVVVNWRAHATTSSKEANHHITADYIASLRTNLEDEYRPAFMQGAAGNLGTYDNSGKAQNTYRWLNKGNEYGQTLANAAKALLDKTQITASGRPMEQIQLGTIQTQQYTYKYAVQAPTQLEIDAATQHNAETGTKSYPCVHTVNGETYVIGSQYHADYILRRNEAGFTKPNATRKIELNVITMGEHLAFVTLPFEASDRYSLQATMETANDYNDWENLENLGFGTPFVMAYANGYAGYIPNNLAYHYNEDQPDPKRYVEGSYESYNSPAAAGEGEKILAQLESMMRDLSDSLETRKCEVCDEANVEWVPLTIALLENNENTLSGGHYYLREDLTYEGVVNITGTVCLDLHGKTYTAYNPNGLARFDIHSGGTLNVTDTQEQGTIVGTGMRSSVSTQLAGGTVLVQAGGELNLYSGTITFLQKDTHVVQDGGVMTIKGTFNMYDGTVCGGVASQYGGNIYVDAGGTMRMYDGIITDGEVTGEVIAKPEDEREGVGGNVLTSKNATFEMRGGQITGGTAATEGPCVYSMGSLTLANDAQASIAFMEVPTQKLVIDGTYTGSVTIAMPGERQVGEVIGSGNATADIRGAQIAIAGSDMRVELNDAKKLVVAEGVYLASIADQRYTTLQAAADAWWQMHNPAPIKLEQAAADQGLHLNLDVDIELDLNGVRLTGLTVSGTGKVYCMDSSTDDYAVNDGYATVPAGSGLQAADGYMMIDDDGLVSFHKVQNRIHSINLRPSNVSLYYGSRFAGDEAVKANVAEYGIALRIGNAPTEGYITGDTEYKYHVAFDREDWVTGTDTNNSYGVLLYGIMTPGDTANALYANANVYGTTYIKTVDGQMHLSEAKVFTLKQVVEAIDGIWSTLDKTQKTHVQSMYSTYKTVMSSWNIPNIRTAAGETVEIPEETDKTLKVLTIGHSLALDSGHMLALIADAEGYGSMKIATLYKGGCSLAEHVGYMNNDTAIYDLYISSTESPNQAPTTTTGVTMRYAVELDDWDIIVLQDAPIFPGYDYRYTNGNLKDIQTFVDQHKQNPNAKFAWHMFWAPPVDETLRATYPGTDGFYDDNYANFDNDRTMLFSEMTRCARQYILSDSSFAYLIPSGTAVENALSSYLEETDLHRDYVHATDLGRVIASYTWFCTLTGVDHLDEIKLDTIPKAFFKSTVGTEDRELTGIEKNIIMEAVNNALAKPLQITQSRYTQTPAN